MRNPIVKYSFLIFYSLLLLLSSSSAFASYHPSNSFLGNTITFSAKASSNSILMPVFMCSDADSDQADEENNSSEITKNWSNWIVDFFPIEINTHNRLKSRYSNYTSEVQQSSLISFFVLYHAWKSHLS